MNIIPTRAAKTHSDPSPPNGFHLTYCLNIHAGESWSEVFQAIREFPGTVRRQVAPDALFGLGLRLSQRAARELLVPERLEEFKAFLADQGFYVFTINGFPYGAFHRTRVKDAVYRPDWTAPERRDYTLALAQILAAILPAGLDGSISTVPLSYRFWQQPPDATGRMIRHLADIALALADIHDRQGCELHLGLEPEPDCLLETTLESIHFFNRQLIPSAVPMIAAARGCPAATAEQILRRHIGICVDTCHLAMQYENPAQSLMDLTQAGIRISKLQVSAALKTRPSPENRAALADFADPVYLHQVKARGPDGAIRSRGDLQQALSEAGDQDDSDTEWRVHCHIPLHFEGHCGLLSTRVDLDSHFFATVRRLGVDHIEIETYTFEVLPEAARPPDVVGSIVAEYAWLLKRLVLILAPLFYLTTIMTTKTHPAWLYSVAANTVAANIAAYMHI